MVGTRFPALALALGRPSSPDTRAASSRASKRPARRALSRPIAASLTVEPKVAHLFPQVDPRRKRVCLVHHFRVRRDLARRKVAHHLPKLGRGRGRRAAAAMERAGERAGGQHGGRGPRRRLGGGSTCSRIGTLSPLAAGAGRPPPPRRCRAPLHTLRVRRPFFNGRRRARVRRGRKMLRPLPPPPRARRAARRGFWWGRDHEGGHPGPAGVAAGCLARRGAAAAAVAGRPGGRPRPGRRGLGGRL